MKIMKKRHKLILHNLIEKDGTLYAALCLELDVASQGRTAKEAEKNLREAVDLYLDTVHEMGVEDQFIPRLAPVEDWIRYYELEAQRVQRELRDHPESVVEFETRVHE